LDNIKIIKHASPSSLNERGDILFPFEEWNITKNGGGWYTQPPLNLNTPYIPLCNINENPWGALEEFNINTAEFRDKVKYICPYTNYTFYWCLPLFILSENIENLIKRTSLPEWKIKKILNIELTKKFQPLTDKNGFKFTKIQRALLGTGYSANTRIDDGEAFLYDTILALSNGDLLCAKVWIWFHRK